MTRPAWHSALERSLRRVGLAREGGAIALTVAALILATIAGFTTLAIAVGRAEVQFDRLLEDKALSRALRVERDLELAANLGIPLKEIRGMYDYAEGIPAQDPDIRFVAVTDLDLNRLHYGGIGRRRLDPLLANPRLKEHTDALQSGILSVGGAINVGEFAITTLPIVNDDGVSLGYVHVAVQARQLRERFADEFIELFPIALLALLLVLELASFAYGSGYRDPLNRLKRLLGAAAEHSNRAVLSGRHAGGELGASMFRFNAVMYRLARRTKRLLDYAAEVRGAVLEPQVADEIDAIERATRDEAAELTSTQLVRESDARPSDIRLPLLAAMAGIMVSIAWPLMKGDPLTCVFATIAALGALLASVKVRAPAATMVVLTIALAMTPLVDQWHIGEAWITLALACGALMGLSVNYWRHNRLVVPVGWIVIRTLTASAIAAVALVSGDGLLIPSVIAVLAIAAAALTLVVRRPVRNLMFARIPPRSHARGSS